MESFKTCSKCKIPRELKEFYPNKKKGGFYPNCRSCCRDIYQQNKNGYIKAWKEKNQELIKAKSIKWREENREKLRERKKEAYRNLSPEEKKKFNLQISEDRRKNPIRKAKAYAYNIEYKEKNKEYLKKKRAERAKERYHSDLNYKLLVLLKCRLYKAVKRNKVKSAKELIGCTSDELKSHLSSKWRCGMSWDNYGKVWDVDHILPIDSFDMSILEEQEVCFHYTNLQPLFKTRKIALEHGCDEIGNIEKKNRIL